MAQATTYPKFRWFILATVTFGYVCAGLLIVAFAPILGEIAKGYDVDVGQATLFAMASYYVASAIGVVIGGALIDKFGIRPLIIAGGAVMAAGCLLTPFITATAGGLAAARILMGLGAGPVSACVSAVAARWFPPQERGIVSGVPGSGMAIGVALGFILTPVATNANHGDWRAAIAWLSIIPIVGLAMCVLTLIGKEPAAVETAAGTGDFALALRAPAFWAGAFGMFMFAWIMNAFNQQTPAYFAVDAPLGLGWGAMAAGQKMVLVQAGMLIGGVAAGLLMDKVLKGNPRPLLLVGFVATGILMYLPGLAAVQSNAALLGIVLFGVGFFENFMIPAISTFLALNYPHGILGKVFAASFGMALVGGAIGVSVGGAILHATNSYAVPMLVVSIVAVLGAMSGFTLYPPKCFSAGADAGTRPELVGVGK